MSHSPKLSPIRSTLSYRRRSPVGWRKILVKADETVAVGVNIALIEEDADVASSPPAQAAPGPDAAPVRNTEQAATPVIESARANAGNGVSTSHAVRQGSRNEEDERQRISPLARRLAREHDIDLNQIEGTGNGGRVRKDDILAYVASQQAASVAAPTLPARPAQPIATPKSLPLPSYTPYAESPVAEAQPSTAGTDEELVTPSRMRLAIAEHMVRSKRTAPHATTVVEVDMTNIAKWLEKNKEDFKQREGYSISFVPFVMKAVCEGIRKFPLVNSSWTQDNKIIIKKRINLGMAVATDAGLVVPTIYDADQFTLAGLAKQISAIAQRARSNKLTIQDMQNSTFVVNNPGTFGTIISVPIINQPHAGILSMDSVVKRPVVIEDDAIAVRSMMYLCLSFDHRILDGAGAGGFLQAVRTKLQSYGREIDVY